VAGCCENGKETSGSIKEGKSVDQLSNQKFLKEFYATWSYLLS
jgi:hypothetical protein